MYHYHYDSHRLAHLYSLEYQQGTATHLSTAPDQALQGGDLYFNQALNEMIESSEAKRAF